MWVDIERSSQLTDLDDYLLLRVVRQLLKLKC
jgi:hypothetical protein